MPKRILTEEQKQRQKEYNKQYYQKTREKQLQQKKEYYIDNKVKITEYKKKYDIDNKDKKKEYNKQYHELYSIKLKSIEGIKHKLNSCKEKDILKNREFNIDEDYVKEILEQQQYKCANCNIQVKMKWTENKDEEQYSINRINNQIGHIKGNCNITCWGCNLKLGHLEQFTRGCIYEKIDKRNEKWNCLSFSYCED